MRKNAEANEHILVCLSPSPSNPKVITAAARMAEAFQASLTAIYIKPTTYDALSDKDTAAELEALRLFDVLIDDAPMTRADFDQVDFNDSLLFPEITRERERGRAARERQKAAMRELKDGVAECSAVFSLPWIRD